MNSRPLFYLVVLAAAILMSAHPSTACADTKRGIAGGQSARENATNTRWLYNWKADPSTVNGLVEGEFHGEYVPMIWNGTPSGVQNRINNILGYKDQYNVEYVLGFNEPELPTQANMTVTQAIDTWDAMTDGFAGSGIKLVSPAVSGNGGINNWLTPFMTEVNNRNGDADPNNNLQVDAIAYHFYTVAYNPQTEANKVLAQIDQLWADYNRPIWLTEFAGTSFSLNNPVHSVEERTAFNTQFLEILIPALESRSYVERYSWWQFGALGQPYSKLVNSSGGVYTPTSIGDAYIGTLETGDSYDFASGEKPATDVHYLRGGTLTNSGSAIATALRAIDAIEGVGTITGPGDWGLSGGSDAFVRIRSGATLQKTGSNTVTFDEVPVSTDGTLSAVAGTLNFLGTSVENDGTLRAAGGTLSLVDGAEVDGAGTMYVDAGGSVQFGAATDTAGSAIRQSLELHGGTIQSNPITSGSHVISSTSTVHTTTTFSGAGDLFVTGAIVAPTGGGGGGITKEGTGTVLFNGNNTYTGDTTVNDGTLRLGFAGTLGTANNIAVELDGVLNVFAKAGGLTLSGQTLALRGQVAGSINATAGSTVEVLDSNASISANLTVSNSTVIVGIGAGQATTMLVEGNYTQQVDGTLELDLLSPETHDMLDVTGVASLSGHLNVSAMAGFDHDYGDAFTIVNAAGGITGEFDTLVLPSLDLGKLFVVDYDANEVVLTVAGSVADFDFDGDVDASDLSVWQNNYGNGLDGLDFLSWQRDFTEQLNLNAAANNVPEPSSAALLVAFALSTCVRIRSKR